MNPKPHPTLQSLEEILDKHAEYYIKQTMKFFQENGESPALSKNNAGDLEAKTALQKLFVDWAESLLPKEITNYTGTDMEDFQKGFNEAIRQFKMNQRWQEIRERLAKK